MEADSGKLQRSPGQFEAGGQVLDVSPFKLVFGKLGL